MQLSKDNPYPHQLFSPPGMPPATTLAFNEKDLEQRRIEGWQDYYQHREYPKHIATGKVKEVINADGGVTEIPITVIVNDENEEREARAEMAQAPAEVAAQPRRGRPAKVVDEVMVG